MTYTLKVTSMLLFFIATMGISPSLMSHEAGNRDVGDDYDLYERNRDRADFNRYDFQNNDEDDDYYYYYYGEQEDGQQNR